MFKKRKLICLGNPNDINVASGTPYYILKYGRELGLISDPIELDLPKNKLRKYFWNVKQYLKNGKYGGYQYSEKFLNDFQIKFTEKAKKTSEKIFILSHHPSIPIYPWKKNLFVDFYIDATNKQIFESYGIGVNIDKRFQSEIILREKNAYEAAGSIFCMCKWAADSVIKDYGINPQKVHFIVGGPNINEDFLKKGIKLTCPKEPTKTNPLIIGFLGKDWARKGGKFTFEVVKHLNSLGIFTILRVMGKRNKDIPNSKLIEHLGYIDKNKDLNKFINEINSWHFSSLFSYSEASPRSNLESLRLGVPILSHNIGGISSTFINNYYGHLFSPFPPINEVSKWIISEIKPYNNYYQKRLALKQISNEITWSKELLKMKDILANAKY